MAIPGTAGHAASEPSGGQELEGLRQYFRGVRGREGHPGGDGLPVWHYAEDSAPDGNRAGGGVTGVFIGTYHGRRA